MTEMTTMTEFEENVSFDADDPDFAPSPPVIRNVLRDARRFAEKFDIKVPTYQCNMSVTSVQPATTESLSRHGSNISLSCHSLCGSLDDSLLQEPHQYHDKILTIEELRAQLNSCFTCGVSWSEEHVSLDCSECGGYSLQRPCPLCDGRCHTAWKRDLTMSHASGKARWIGECGLSCGPSLEESLVPAFEKLRATS
ncbi:protein pinocchio isoform X1 [Formica exsecta]|uniref:protein pinocchio isoform X1 n=1 Tax=Formica exsecta TaxID=72781 RepID=UPI00114149C5|nr:protein pinocchio isoform X1 [Formica exsecta]